MNVERIIGNLLFLMVISIFTFPIFYKIHVSKIRSIKEVRKVLISGLFFIVLSVSYVAIAKGLKFAQIYRILLFQEEFVNPIYPHMFTTSALTIGYLLVLYWFFCVAVLQIKRNKKNIEP